MLELAETLDIRIKSGYSSLVVAGMRPAGAGAALAGARAARVRGLDDMYVCIIVWE
jgi:hypothetical protein